MIEIRGLSKQFGGRNVLEDVTFDVRPGEIVRLLGANGAGKSTLLRCLLGVIDFDGDVRVAGLDPRTRGCDVRALVGYMPQQNGLHLDLSVGQTMAFYADLRHVDRSRIAPVLAEAGLSREFNTRVGHLSGGMRQRLSFSVAVLSDPAVLVLDEPNASLDTASHAWLSSRIDAAAAAGRVVIVSTHLGQSLFENAPRSLLLENGRIAADLPAGDDRWRLAEPAERPTPRRSGWAPLLRKQLRDDLRNRWVIGYALILGGLGLTATIAGLGGAGGPGLDHVGRTTATLMNLCLLLAPLLAVLMGASSVAAEAERGTLDHLLAQPVSRTQILLAKHFGLLITLLAATLAGFVPAGIMVGRGAGWAALGYLLLFPSLAVFAASGMAAIGLAISVSSRSAVGAQGAAVLVWFTLAIFYDLLIIGVLAAAAFPAPMLAATLLANPIDAARVLGVLALEPDLYLLGPAGAYLMSAWGSALTSVLLAVSLAAWAVVPVLAALIKFRVSPRRSRHHEHSSQHSRNRTGSARHRSGVHAQHGDIGSAGRLG
jgi:ABC-type multidrug transport system ATPase subunit/ABC-type transport system involved in multi-copper enzyme maturation permease subunit